MCKLNQFHWKHDQTYSESILFACSQGYQFWTRADGGGYFSINNICTGDYNLYAWVPGFIGDFRCDVPVTITSGILMNR